MNTIRTVVYLRRVSKAKVLHAQRLWTYVAPATTSSVILALVEPDSTAMNILAAVMIATIRAVKLYKELHMMTGASKSVTMKGVINIRASCMVDACATTCTLGSREMLKYRCHRVSAPASCCHSRSWLTSFKDRHSWMRHFSRKVSNQAITVSSVEARLIRSWGCFDSALAMQAVPANQFWRLRTAFFLAVSKPSIC